METANLVTYSALWQVIAIFAGTSFAYFSLVISLVVRWYIHDTNRRDRDYHRRFREMEETNERRFREMEEANERRFAEIERRFREMEEANERRFRGMEEANERRHQELLKTVGALYHHVHADGSPAIVPMPGIDPAVAPAPADN